MGYSVERLYLYRRETEHSRQKLKKSEKIAVTSLIVGLRRWFTFKNLRNMRLVSMEMNRIGNCSIVYVTERDDRELEAPSSFDPAVHLHGKTGGWRGNLEFRARCRTDTDQPTTRGTQVNDREGDPSRGGHRLPTHIAPAARNPQVVMQHDSCVDTLSPWLHTARTVFALRELVACWQQLSADVRERILRIARGQGDISRFASRRW
jgi:hypothetical protein